MLSKTGFGAWRYLILAFLINSQLRTVLGLPNTIRNFTWNAELNSEIMFSYYVLRLFSCLYILTCFEILYLIRLHNEWIQPLRGRDLTFPRRNESKLASMFAFKYNSLHARISLFTKVIVGIMMVLMLLWWWCGCVCSRKNKIDTWSYKKIFVFMGQKLEKFSQTANIIFGYSNINFK